MPLTTSCDAPCVINDNARCVLSVKRKVRHMCVMARDDPHFRLRIPAALKAKIELSAEANNRSINAEIVQRLEHTFEKILIDPSDYDRMKIYDPERLKEEIERDVYDKLRKIIRQEMERSGGKDFFEEN